MQQSSQLPQTIPRTAHAANDYRAVNKTGRLRQ